MPNSQHTPRAAGCAAAAFSRPLRVCVTGAPEGHPWEIAHNPHWTLTPEGGVRLAG